MTNKSVLLAQQQTKALQKQLNNSPKRNLSKSPNNETKIFTTENAFNNSSPLQESNCGKKFTGFRASNTG